MNRLLKLQQKYAVKWLVSVQLSTTLLVTNFLALTIGQQAILPAIVSGLICLGVNAYFVAKVFSCTGATQMRRIVKTFYGAEAVKLLLFASLVGGVIRYTELDALTLIIALAVNQLLMALSWIVVKPPLSVSTV